MIDKKLQEEIDQFCKLNEIPDVVVFINECLTTGFNIKKYGMKPIAPQPTQKVEVAPLPPPDYERMAKETQAMANPIIVKKTKDDDDDYFN